MDLWLYTVYTKGVTVHVQYLQFASAWAAEKGKYWVCGNCYRVLSKSAIKGIQDRLLKGQTQLTFSQYKDTSSCGLFSRLSWQASDLHW